MVEDFSKGTLRDIFVPGENSKNGQVTIIGGSELFHGAPLLSLITASRIVDMVFFATPEKSIGNVAEKMKSKLASFIWIPWDEVDSYAKKSDALLIGPGMMSYRKKISSPHGTKNHICEDACRKTRLITKSFLQKYPDKPWVIDAGSLQVMDLDWLPKGAIITPNKKEFEILFGKNDNVNAEIIKKTAEDYNCTIVYKGPTTLVSSKTQFAKIEGDNPGLSKGGTGDVLAGLIVSLLAQNDSFLAASAGDYILKKTADELAKKVGTNYNADDLANKIPEVFYSLIKHE